jgi:hypothetical protein
MIDLIRGSVAFTRDELDELERAVEDLESLSHALRGSPQDDEILGDDLLAAWCRDAVESSIDALRRGDVDLARQWAAIVMGTVRTRRDMTRVITEVIEAVVPLMEAQKDRTSGMEGG